ncbi:MAG: Three prime repair exonuclease 1, partial [Marteilia pararefringens]
FVSSEINTASNSVCLVAHNGQKFDFPILEALIEKFKMKKNFEHLVKIDSLKAFQAIDRSVNGFVPTKSFKLSEIYERLFGKKIRDSHRSEADTLACIECAQKFGQEFHKYIILNFEPLFN